MRNRAAKYSALLLCVLCLSVGASAQEFNSWLRDHIRENVKARIDQTDDTKQSEAPTIGENSTSLVERSSAPDLLGLGMDFLKLSDSGQDKKSATPKSLTFSAYALKTMLSGNDALDPEVYNRDRKWRSLSFTLGYDVPENTDDREPIIGVKWLAHNGRDVSSSGNQKYIDQVQDALNSAGQSFSAIRDDARRYMFAVLQKRGKLPAGVADQEDFDDALAVADKFAGILGALTDDEKKNLDQLISKYISAFVNLDAASKGAVKKIRSRPQLALAFQTKQGRNNRPDEYKGVLSFDKGMGTSSITLNGDFIFKDKKVGKDARGGTFAAAVHMPLQGFNPLDYKDPLTLSLSADATAMTGETPMFRAQAKVTIPFGKTGMEFPISISVANRTEFVKETEVRGKFGFTFDLSKALKAFQDTFQKRLIE